MPKKRVSVDLEEVEHNRLKSKLALEGLGISEWIRQLIAEKLGEK